MRSLQVFGTVMMWYLQVLSGIGAGLFFLAAWMNWDIYPVMTGVALVGLVACYLYLPVGWKLELAVLAFIGLGALGVWYAQPVPEIVRLMGIISPSVGLLVLWNIMAPRLPERLEDQVDGS